MRKPGWARHYVQQRLVMEQRLETKHTARLSKSRIKGFAVHAVVQSLGMLERGRTNMADVQIRRNRIAVSDLPTAFEGFTILQISDLHADISRAAISRLGEILVGLDYDICALTGDFRGHAHGDYVPSLESMSGVMAAIRRPAYGILGNHDSVLMLQGLEGMGIRMLMNEAATLNRGNRQIHLIGLDDPNHYRMDDLGKAAAGISRQEVSILLSHTPENFRKASKAGMDVMLSGHTHGGQVCLPGSVPVATSAGFRLPRRMVFGAWKFRNMAGYTSSGVGTSLVDVRFNCAPEIVLHELISAG